MTDVRSPVDAAMLRWFRDYASHGIFTTDCDLRICSWNRWLVTLTGLAEDDVIGSSVADALPSFVERGFDRFYRDALLGTVTVLSHSLHRFIVPARAANGTAPPSSQSGRIGPLVDDDRLVGTITVIEDVSERLATERELRAQIATSEAARRTAEAASRVRDEFLATLSHEIRTPLNAVLGWTRILMARDMDAATVRKAIEVIDRNASAQLTLIGDMLDMSRIAAGKLRMDVSVVDLQPVTLAAIDVVRPAADAKGVYLVTELAAGVPPVTGDHDRLVQVVWNLLSNAVKFTDPGGTITVSLGAADAHVRLRVADDGQGIAPDFLPHVFERFKQADASSSRRHGGLGLGLALVRELVELHGGRVTVDSAGLGKGSTFVVMLPPRVEGFVAPRAVRSPLTDGAAGLGGIRVLVIESDAEVREVIVRSVADFGAEVDAVYASPEALSYLRDQPDDRLPHVIVAGGLAVASDGAALLSAIRLLPRERGGAIPVVALVPAGSDDAAGFSARIEKPFAPLALAAAIARVTAGIDQA